jgi:hypothetical protein
MRLGSKNRTCFSFTHNLGIWRVFFKFEIRGCGVLMVVMERKGIGK